MQVVCEATQNSSVDVQVGAFECLVRIMGLYYDKMVYYMEQALFGVCPLLLLTLNRALTSIHSSQWWA
jgi:importin subunit beta-1